MPKYYYVISMFLLFMGLSACSLINTGSQSMQVDMHVYRGPLSKSIPIQKSELEYLYYKTGCVGSDYDIDEVEKLKPIIQCGTAFVLETIEYVVHPNRHKDCKEMQEKKKIIECLEGKEVASKGYGYRKAALECLYIFSEIPQLCGEIGNQLVARANVLSKQMEKIVNEKKVKGLDRQGLPLSDYLRDSTITRFWDAQRNDSDFSTLSFSTNSTETEKFRMLMDDRYWSHVNQVHANGWGSTKMAFIKDNIGNWTLKSYSNKPGELLEAYDSVLKSTVGIVTEQLLGAGTVGVAKAIDEKLSTTERSLRLINKVAFGGNEEVNKEKTVDQINLIKNRYNKKITGLKTTFMQKVEKLKEDIAEIIKIKDKNIAENRLENPKKIIEQELTKFTDLFNTIYLDLLKQLELNLNQEYYSKFQKAKYVEIYYDHCREVYDENDGSDTNTCSQDNETAVSGQIDMLIQYANTIHALETLRIGFLKTRSEVFYLLNREIDDYGENVAMLLSENSEH